MSFALWMTDVSQNNRTSLSDHCHRSEKRNSAVWTVFHVSEQQNFTLWPFPRSRETELRRLNEFRWTDHQRFALCWVRALGCSASAWSGPQEIKPGGISPYRPLVPGRALRDWARHRPFDHISQAAGGQFGVAKFALWRDSISPGQAVCSHWRTGTSYPNSSSGLKAISGIALYESCCSGLIA